MRLMIDNIGKRVVIDGVVFAVSSPDLGAGIDNVTFDENFVGTVQFSGTYRAKFADPSPYQDFVNGWMTANTALTLAQAKTIKSELVDGIYNAKRQLPVAAVISLGTFNWDASDVAVQNYGMIAGAAAAIDQARFVGGQQNTANITMFGAGAPQIVLPVLTTSPITPFGASAPLTVTSADVLVIASAVSAARAIRETVGKSLKASINAAASVAAVIAFDATSGW